MMKFFIFLIFSITVCKTHAQELLCNVSVIAPKENLADKKTLKGLENAIRDFMNNTKWTENSYNTSERIECGMLLTINAIKDGSYSGTLQVTSSRPVYGSSYSTSMLNFLDKSLDFAYQEYQPLQYMKGSYSNELTAILAFYAYIVIALDNDSYSLFGGTTALNEAVTINNTAQTSGGSGWKSGGKDDRNRYYLITALTDDKNKEFHKIWYNYHRQGFDLMQQDVEVGRANVTTAVEELKGLWNTNPFNLCLIQFFYVKANELMNLYGNASTSQKQKMMQLLPEMDPVNANKYQEKIRE